MRSTSSTAWRPRSVQTWLIRIVWLVALALAGNGLQQAPVYAAVPAGPSSSLGADPAASYVQQLLDEINGHRGHDGSPPLRYVSPNANQAVSQYLSDLTPRMLAANSCFHGTGGTEGVQPSWDYMAANGVNERALGEVLGCPGFDGYWTPSQIANRWWQSPPHRTKLYLDRTADTLACGVYGPQRGGKAYQTIACVTLRSD